MIKILIICVAIALLFGCNKDAISSVKTDNQNFNVELLFTHDGCKVYRFEDYRTHYFTNCTETISTHSENCGKNCTRIVDKNIRGIK